jgi:hypothetical protein
VSCRRFPGIATHLQALHGITHHFNKHGRHGLGKAQPGPVGHLRLLVLPFGCQGRAAGHYCLLSHNASSSCTACLPTCLPARLTAPCFAPQTRAAKAVGSVVMELTLLGLFGLILGTFSAHIGEICSE